MTFDFKFYKQKNVNIKNIQSYRVKLYTHSEIDLIFLRYLPHVEQCLFMQHSLIYIYYVQANLLSRLHITLLSHIKYLFLLALFLLSRALSVLCTLKYHKKSWFKKKIKIKYYYFYDNR